MLLFHAGKIPSVNKPQIILLLISQRNTVSAWKNNLKIFNLGIQEVNTQRCTQTYKNRVVFKELLAANVGKSLGIKYCR